PSAPTRQGWRRRAETCHDAHGGRERARVMTNVTRIKKPPGGEPGGLWWTDDRIWGRIASGRRQRPDAPGGHHKGARNEKAIHRMIAGLTVAGALALPTAFAAVQAPTPQFDLTKVTDNVYSFRFLTHRAMVVVTSDGVIVTDPINSVAAKNMMDEIKKITNK